MIVFLVALLMTIAVLIVPLMRDILVHGRDNILIRSFHGSQIVISRLRKELSHFESFFDSPVSWLTRLLKLVNDTLRNDLTLSGSGRFKDSSQIKRVLDFELLDTVPIAPHHRDRDKIAGMKLIEWYAAHSELKRLLIPLGLHIAWMKSLGKFLPIDDPIQSDSKDSHRSKSRRSSDQSAPRLRSQSISFISADEGDGKTTLAINYAMELAEQGSRVLLIDLSMRRSKTSSSPDAQSNSGIEDSSGRPNAFELIHSTRVRNLSLLGAVGPVASGTASLEPSVLLRLLVKLRDSYEYLVFDYPEWSQGAEFESLLPNTGQLVFVARAGCTSIARAKMFVARLKELNLSVFGLVVNEEIAGSSGWYTYEYYSNSHSDKLPMRRGVASVDRQE